MMHGHHLAVILVSTLSFGMACGEKRPTAPVAGPVDAPAGVGDRTAGDVPAGNAANDRSEEPSRAVAVGTSAKDVGTAANDNPQKEPNPANHSFETDAAAAPDQAASGENTGESETGDVDTKSPEPATSPSEVNALRPTEPGADVVAVAPPSPGPIRRVVLTEKWSVESETRDGWNIVVGAKHVFVTATGFQKSHKVGLAAIDKETGEIAWTKPLVTEVRVFGDVVVTWRPFQVLDANTGKQLWARKGIMNYMDFASNGEFLAFVSLEREPLRYRLTVAELRTGRELYHVDAPGLDNRAIEQRAALSFDAHGLWVADRLMPTEPPEREAAWVRAVNEANDRGSAFPCHTVSDARYILSRNQLVDPEVLLFDRRKPGTPRWRFTSAQFPPDCSRSRLVIDGDNIYSANDVWISDENGGLEGVSDFLRVVRHSPIDGHALWSLDGVDRSRRFLQMPFGLLLAGYHASPNDAGGTGPLAIDHNGKEIEVIGYLPQRSAADNGVVYAREKGRVMRIEVRTEP